MKVEWGLERGRQQRLLFSIEHGEGMNEVVLCLFLVRAGVLHYTEKILKLKSLLPVREG